MDFSKSVPFGRYDLSYPKNFQAPKTQKSLKTTRLLTEHRSGSPSLLHFSRRGIFSTITRPTKRKCTFCECRTWHWQPTNTVRHFNQYIDQGKFFGGGFLKEKFHFLHNKIWQTLCLLSQHMNKPSKIQSQCYITFSDVVLCYGKKLGTYQVIKYVFH